MSEAGWHDACLGMNGREAMHVAASVLSKRWTGGVVAVLTVTTIERYNEI